ncbi:unnamed protein product, partial [Meganyctiphanes norvegica]
MLKSVLENYEDLLKLFTQHKPSELRRVTAINFDLLKELTEFLSKFAEATKMFDAENTPALHLVIPKMKMLEKHCEPNRDDFPSMKSVKKTASSFISSKFKPHILHKVAVFLNPKQKSMRVLSKEDQDLVLSYVNEKIDSLSRSSFEVKVKEEPGTPPSKKARYDIDEFDDIVEVSDKQYEVQAYQNQIVTNSDPSKILAF